MTIRTCGAAFSLLVAMINPVACLAQEASSERILFGSAQGGMNADIYVVGADGTGLTRLTSERGGNQVAAWSPDGSRIAYRHGLDYIMVMDADGSNPQLLADTDGDNPEFDLSPDWSPDGSRIVFDSSIGGSDRDIFVVGADGTGLTNLTNDAFTDYRPRWSPDGSTILFESYDRPQGLGIYRMRADGTEVAFVAHGHGAAWSHDGTRIAYSVTRENAWDIVMSDADGTNPQVLMEGKVGTLAMLPAWSPDDSRIAFVALDQNAQGLALYTMDADGANRTRISGDIMLFFDMQQWMPPAWSPDGTMIAVTATDDGAEAPEPDYDVYLIAADGSFQRALAPSPAPEFDPVWAPVMR